MTADIKIDGNRLSPQKGQLWAGSVSVLEEVSGLSLTDTTGGVGTIQAAIDQLAHPLAMQGKRLDLDFGDRGTAGGRVSTINDSQGSATLTADTRLSVLNRTVSVPPTSPYLGNHIAAIFTRCGLSSGDYAIDNNIFYRPAVLPGWEANAWQKLKELQAVEDFEIVTNGEQLVVRGVGVEVADISGHHSLGTSTSTPTLGLYVETHMYTHRSVIGELVYPPAVYDSEFGGTTVAGWSPDAQVIEVSPGQPIVIEVPLMASLTNVVQPECVAWVEKDATDSVYTVTTNDGVRAVDPAVWTARGGAVNVKILPDTSTLEITVTAGSNSIAGAPYRLMLDDGKTQYSTLRIVGNGVVWSKDRLRQRTSVPESETDNEISSSTDSMYVRDRTRAHAMLRAQAASTPASVSGSVSDLPQPIGSRAGVLVNAGRANYRIRSVTTTAVDVGFDGVRHTSVAAHNAAMTGKKVVDANNLWGGLTVAGHNATPLPYAPSDIFTPSPMAVPTTGALPGPVLTPPPIRPVRPLPLPPPRVDY